MWLCQSACAPHTSSHLCGSLGYYDVAKEKRISLKSPLPLQTCERVFHKVTTTDDPIIRKVSGGTLGVEKLFSFKYMHELLLSIWSVG